VTSSSDDKLARARDLAAERGVNHRREDVVAAVMDFTRGRGVDVVIDNVGEASWPASLRAVRRGGRIVTCGATSGPQPRADLQRVFIRQIQIFGSTLGTHDEFRALLTAVAQRQIVPLIDRCFDFAEAEQALDYLEQGRQFGKLTLRVDPGLS
ncbi:MAG: zinc-binding dehydrogenase, partial [Gammaproteobacteria bacterium]|nr:zinc-binding dehydrogenase [Gammaproteobacteria bacterium]